MMYIHQLYPSRIRWWAAAETRVEPWSPFHWLLAPRWVSTRFWSTFVSGQSLRVGFRCTTWRTKSSTSRRSTHHQVRKVWLTGQNCIVNHQKLACNSTNTVLRSFPSNVCLFYFVLWIMLGSSIYSILKYSIVWEAHDTQTVPFDNWFVARVVVCSRWKLQQQPARCMSTARTAEALEFGADCEAIPGDWEGHELRCEVQNMAHEIIPLVI